MGGELQISSGGDYQRIFLGLKFLIPGFFWGRFGKYFFGWIDFNKDFFGYSNNLNIFVVVPTYPRN